MALPRRRVSTCCGCGLGREAFLTRPARSNRLLPPPAAEPMASANFLVLMLAARPKEAMPALRLRLVPSRKGLGGVSCGVSPPSPPPPPPPPPLWARRRFAHGVSPMLAESCHNEG